MRPFARARLQRLADGDGGRRHRLDNAVLFTFGKEPRSFPSLLAHEADRDLRRRRLSRCSSSFPWSASRIAVALHLLFAAHPARQGLAGGGAECRCGAADGHQRQRAIAAAYALSTALAGLAGLLIAPLFSVHSDMGTLFGIKAFAVAILGGITSAPGRDARRPPLWPDRGAGHGASSARPTRRSSCSRWSSCAGADAQWPVRPRRRSRRYDEAAMHRLAVTPFAVLATAGLGVGLLGEGYTPFVLALVALTAIVGVGLNILVGLAGQISIGHVGFYAIGAYAVAILTLKGSISGLALALRRRARRRRSARCSRCRRCAFPGPTSP